MRTLPTSAPPSSIILLSGSSQKFENIHDGGTRRQGACAQAKQSMLTFSKYLQNDLKEEGRTDVGKVLIGQNSPKRTLPTSAPPSSIILLSGSSRKFENIHDGGTRRQGACAQAKLCSPSLNLQNDLKEEGRTDVGKVLIGQNSPRRTSAPPSSIILLSGSSRKFENIHDGGTRRQGACAQAKKSMLTFSRYLQNDLKEEGRTDVGKVLIANISSTFFYHFAEWLLSKIRKYP